MNRCLCVASLLSLGLLLVADSGARAQVPSYLNGFNNPYTNPFNSMNQLGRPQLSPYLQLLRGGNPAANYFLGVLPEQQRRADEALYGSAIQNLYQREQNPSTDQSTDSLLPSLPQTGHGTGYQYYGSYYTFPVRTPTYMPFPGAPGGIR